MVLAGASDPKDIPSPAVPRQTAGRLDYLDGIRGLCALYVMVCHGFWPFINAHPTAPSIRVITQLTSYGHLAVDIFLALSGFSLMLPVARTGSIQDGAAGFLRRRARRILPPYVAVVLIATASLFAVQALSRNHGLRFDPTGWLVNALLLQDVFPQYYHQLDPATWTVAAEWKIYFVFPLLVWLLRRGGVKVVLLVSGGLGAVLTALWVHFQPTLSLEHTCPWYVGLFGIGACCSAVGARPEQLNRLRVPGAMGLATLMYLLVVQPEVLTHKPNLFMALVDISTGVAAGCAFALWKHRPPRLLTWRPLVFVGTFAYSLYLLHMVVLSWWTSFLNTDFLQHLARRGFVTVVPGLSHALNALAVCCQFLRFQLPLLVFVAYPLTVSLSYLFFCCCERRFLGTRPQATPAETARDAALSPAI